ncbi:MAG: peptide chain release factor N(5)-glutamine methyltransferase [Lachnospiraceae bacterium]|nr:peptide chain release factor N(5)-glutamine methyltransferase [Lachnospiraceae bacterium]
MNYREALKSGEKELEASGIECFEVDAYSLLAHVTGKNRTFILSHGDEEDLTDREQEIYSLLIEKRAGRVPLQHLIGSVDFMGLEFLVCPRVLIPRIDTEFLVEEALRVIDDGSRVLDLCVGSGCILLSIMKYKNGIDGVGSDISDEALELSSRNAEKLGLSPVLIKGDMFENIEGKFDYIISNPPYIRTDDIDSLQEEVRLYDPRIALDGGFDGLDFYRVIAGSAAQYLNREGRIFLEIGYDQGEEVKRIFEDAGYLDVEMIRDYSGNMRVIKCLKNWKL